MLELSNQYVTEISLPEKKSFFFVGAGIALYYSFT
jgi:hypothetical protein